MSGPAGSHLRDISTTPDKPSTARHIDLYKPCSWYCLCCYHRHGVHRYALCLRRRCGLHISNVSIEKMIERIFKYQKNSGEAKNQQHQRCGQSRDKVNPLHDTM